LWLLEHAVLRINSTPLPAALLLNPMSGARNGGSPEK
jgi:hypothetical protein